MPRPDSPVRPNDLPETKQPYRPAPRAVSVDRVLDATDELMHRLSEEHSVEFLEIGITMPQAKVLYLAAVDGGLRMSALAARLRVTISTVSGLVDRLVDAGLLTRRDDPHDRRQVLVSVTPEGQALIDRFRELNRRQLRELLERLSGPDLAVVEHAIEVLSRAAPDHAMTSRPTTSHPTTDDLTPGKPGADQPATTDRPTFERKPA